MRTVIRTKTLSGNFLKIETNREIVSSTFRGSFFKNVHPNKKQIDQIGELGAMIVEWFFFCEGVVKVEVHSPYGFTVEKGLAFNWSQIEVHLIDALRYCLHYGISKTREFPKFAKALPARSEVTETPNPHHPPNN